MRAILSILLLAAMLASHAVAATTYTTNYNLAKPSDGSTTWGASIRDDLDTIDAQMFINSNSISSHITDTTDAHDASAISSTAGPLVCTSSLDVQSYLNCLDNELGVLTGGQVVTLNTTQTITGAKTFTSLIQVNNGITVTGTTTLSSLSDGVMHTVGGIVSSSPIVDADLLLSAPDLGTPSALVGTNITGTASALNIGGNAATATTASNVTTNANLTGEVVSVGNATTLGSFASLSLSSALTDETGSGSAVFSTSPTLVTPNLGTPTTLVGTNITGTAASLSIGGTSDNVTGIVAVANGGTGLAILTSNNVILGNGTSSPTFIAPGTMGNVLTSNGTTWISSPSAGGGGGSLQWIESANAPISSTDSANNRVFLFESSLGQSLYASIKVPQTYVSGSQIKMYLQFYSADSSGTALMQSISTLIRTGTDTFSNTTNQRTSTNAAVTLSGGTVDIPQQVILDLTSATGQINGVSVSAGNYINVNLTRGTDTATSDISSLVYNAEVTFQ